jgi:hypothetical protein
MTAINRRDAQIVPPIVATEQVIISANNRKMNRRALVALADRYALLLESNGAVLRRADLDPCFDAAADRLTLLCHARWQVEMIRRIIGRVGGESTAIRLLGSAQGLLVATGLTSIGETWQDNETWLDATSIRAFDSASAEVG